MALLIFLRETWDKYDVSLPSIALWQLGIWLLWLPIFKLMAYVAIRIDRGASTQNKFKLFLYSGLFLITHYLWYFTLSDNFSPLIPLPHTAYGVYPYFFIFYFMIDLVVVSGLWGRLGAFKLLEEKPSLDIEEIITVKKGYNNILVEMDDINWVAAENYYARIYTNQESFLLREPLKVLIDRLPANTFLQIHRSTLVKRNYIERYTSTEATLKDGHVRRISKSGMKRLQQAL